jgi:hypothetical protein
MNRNEKRFRKDPFLIRVFFFWCAGLPVAAEGDNFEYNGNEEQDCGA